MQCMWRADILKFLFHSICDEQKIHIFFFFFFSSVCDFWSLIFLAIMWSREKKVISLISSQRARGAHTAHNNFSIGITDNYSATCSPSVHTCSIVVVSDIQSTKFRTEYRFYCFSVVSPIFFSFLISAHIWHSFLLLSLAWHIAMCPSRSISLSLSFSSHASAKWEFSIRMPTTTIEYSHCLMRAIEILI